MKLIHKLSILLLGVVLWSCGEEVPERELSPVASDSSIKVYFPKSNKGVVEVEPVETNVKIVVSRVNSGAQVTVPLKVVDKAKVFTAPESVTFLAGESDAEITVGFSKLELFEVYTLELSVGIEFTNPYLINNEGTTNFVLHLQQSDWKDYAVGTYRMTSPPFAITSKEQKLQYSEILDSYRFPSLWAAGTNYLFKWDGSDEIIPSGPKNASGLHVFVTGYMHPTHGMVTSQTDPDPDYTYYDDEAKKFVFDRIFTVAAGSFGWKTESFTVETFLNQK